MVLLYNKRINFEHLLILLLEKLKIEILRFFLNKLLTRVIYSCNLQVLVC